MKRSIVATRHALRALFFQRCFYLFVTLLALVALAPFIQLPPGRLLVRSMVNAFVILAAVAAVGRSIQSFLFVLALAVPAIVFRWLAFDSGDPKYVDLALRFDAAVYASSIVLLLRYVFERGVMDADRLWGAAAAYLMIGVFWAFLFAIVDRANPESFAVRGTTALLGLSDLLYFSFSTLTTTGFGDIVPLTDAARTAASIEGIVGTLFLAILIAKLVGVYPPPRSRSQAFELDETDTVAAPKPQPQEQTYEQ